MFLSYEYKDYLGYDEKINQYQYRYRYKIIDSDFEIEGVTGQGESVGVISEVGGKIIQEYSKRNLNVAANLVRCFQYSSKKHGCTINKIIEWNRKYNPDFNKYEKELEKYLSLI